MSHYVYFLFRKGSNELLYIGRSNEPERRRKHFQARTGIEVEPGVPLRFSSLEKASAAELRAIAKYRPPFNRLDISSPGFLGRSHSAEARARIGAPKKGGRIDEEQRAKISAACKGRAPTIGFTGRKHAEESRRKLSTRVISAETRERMSAAQKARQERARCSSRHSS